MSANITDHFTKAKERWTGSIGSGGVADGTVTTIPLSSATGLPTSTAIYLAIDRVDANGNETSSKFEVIKGIVSGSNIDCSSSSYRGIEGTAQAHDAGAVVEFLATASAWNEMVDGILVEHNQDGTHDDSKVAMLAGSQTFTGDKTFSGAVKVDTISEKTSDNGVAVDGVTLKDGGITLDSGSTVNAIKDEDDMASDSATALATQQSIKAYVDNSVTATTVKARVYLSSDQLNLTDTVPTKVQLDTESYDTGSNFDNSTNYRFTVPTTGYYLVSATVTYQNLVANKRYTTAIYKNGTRVSSVTIGNGGATDYMSVPISDIIYLTSGDYIELYAQVIDTGVNTIDINGSPSQTFMSIHLLST